MPSSSSGPPKRAIGVCATIDWPRGVRRPVSRSISRNSFWRARKKPGAIAFTRIAGRYSCAMCTASHCVKLVTPALAAEYATMRVSGLNAFIDETFRMAPSRARPTADRTPGREDRADQVQIEHPAQRVGGRSKKNGPGPSWHLGGCPPRR